MQKLPPENFNTRRESEPGVPVRSSKTTYCFGPYELDLDRYELRRAGRRLRLGRSPMELLILMVERYGALADREVIAARLWPEPGLVDVDAGINTAIKRVREVLNDDPSKPRYIETVVGKGYRFIAETTSTPGNHLPAGVPDPALLFQADAKLSIIEPKLSVWRPRSLVFTLLWLVLILALTAAFSIWYFHRRTFQPAVSLEQVTTNDSEQRVTAAAVSPDGRWIAFADITGISLRVLQTGETAVLKSPEDFRAARIAWFPGSLTLLVSGFSVHDVRPTIWIVFITGAAPRLFRQDAENGTPSPEGTQVLFTAQGGSELWTAGVDGEDARRLIADRRGTTFPVVFWSADGKRISYLRRQSMLRPGQFESVAANSGKVLAVQNGITMDSAAALRDGRVIFLRDSPSQMRNAYSIWEVPTNLRTGAFLSVPIQIASLGKAKAFSLGSSDDGSKLNVVLEQGQPHVYVGKLQPPGPTLAQVRRLTSDTRTDYPKTWLHDNQTVIFESDRTGVFRLYKQSLNDRASQELSMGTKQAVLPQVTPDGKWILYTVKPNLQPSSPAQLFRLPAQGGAPAEVLSGGLRGEVECPVSGDSICILRETPNDEAFVFYRLDPETGKGPEVGRTSWLPHVVEDWCVSPNGSFAALTSHEAGSSKIRLVPLSNNSGQREEEIDVKGFGRLSGIKWAPDNQGWFVVSDTETESLILYVTRQGNARVLREVPLSTWGIPSPDGQKLAFVDQAVDSNVWTLARNRR